MRQGRKLDRDGVVRPDNPALEHNRHHAAFAHEPFGRRDGEPLEQAGLEVLDLLAGIAQAGDFHHGIRAEPEPRAGRQAEQVHAPRQDIFAEVARADDVSLRRQFVQQLRMDQVHLSEVRNLAEAPDVEEVLVGGAGMGIALDAEILDEPDGRRSAFAEGMSVADVNADDPRTVAGVVLQGQVCRLPVCRPPGPGCVTLPVLRRSVQTARTRPSPVDFRSGRRLPRAA